MWNTIIGWLSTTRIKLFLLNMAEELARRTDNDLDDALVRELKKILE